MDIEVIWVFGKAEYFFKRGLTAFLKSGPSGKSVGASGAPKWTGRLVRHSLKREGGSVCQL
jgi:hypothetical protein